ncbi:hypothetical protein MAR_007241 [Mya arenaria]|uniref:CEMIP beta-helix domain-containing protein n=1 Tax=Mya arenaria TaxID=6604 RepID=A0ABY7DDH1_MYAAR|nr:hypothetical protein MAR_007241 [Mya arenaria]
MLRDGSNYRQYRDGIGAYKFLADGTKLQDFDVYHVEWDGRKLADLFSGNPISFQEEVNALGHTSTAVLDAGNGLLFLAESIGISDYRKQEDNFRVGDNDAIYPKVSVLDDVSTWQPAIKQDAEENWAETSPEKEQTQTIEFLDYKSKNKVVNNAAAGGQGFGFWFIFPDNPFGSSASLGLMAEGENNRTNHRGVYNNVALSNLNFGIKYGGILHPNGTTAGGGATQPLADPMDLQSEEQWLTFTNLTVQSSEKENTVEIFSSANLRANYSGKASKLLGGGRYTVSGQTSDAGWEGSEDGELISGFTWYQEMEDGSQQKYHVVRPDHLTADAHDCYLREEWRLAFGDLLVIGICFPSDGYYSIEVIQPYQLDMDALVSVGSRDELEKSDSYDGKKFYFDSTTK